ncbi:hypothetical protein HK405_001974, partial [Cladochytrium tenue]
MQQQHFDPSQQLQQPQYLYPQQQQQQQSQGYVHSYQQRPPEAVPRFPSNNGGLHQQQQQQQPVPVNYGQPQAQQQQQQHLVTSSHAPQQVFSHNPYTAFGAQQGHYDNELQTFGLQAAGGGGTGTQPPPPPLAPEDGDGTPSPAIGSTGAVVAAVGTAGEDAPLYVNAKQYHRILKRREARQRMEAARRNSKKDK